MAFGTTGTNHKAVNLTSTVMFDIDRGIPVSRQAAIQMGLAVELTTADRQDLVKASD